MVTQILNNLEHNPAHKIIAAHKTLRSTFYYLESILKLGVDVPNNPSEKTELVIWLHPIFVNQIDKYWIEYPRDYLERVYAANGPTQKLSDVTLLFLDYLAHLRAHRNKKKFNPEILASTLYYKVARNLVADKKRGTKAIEKRIEKAIQIALKIELLKGYSKEESKSGEVKYVWEINNEWC